MKTIVVGYDGSDAGERAPGRAAEIAAAFSARLLVVSVSGSAYVPAPVSAFEPAAGFVPPVVAGPAAGGTVLPAKPEPAPPDPEELARRQLERARLSLATENVEAEYVADLGEPAERLLAVADQRDADLIVVGSRERGFLERLLGHSVDEAVARALRSRRPARALARRRERPFASVGSPASRSASTGVGWSDVLESLGIESAPGPAATHPFLKLLPATQA